MHRKPFIVGIGGTARANSTSELALSACLGAARAQGAETLAFSGDALALPLYSGAPSVQARTMIDAIRRCDGLLIATPSYHGSVSGTLKNALDYLEELRGDSLAYLDGRAVGIIVCAYGVQGIGTTIEHTRAIVHALRGWPTPMAAGILSSGPMFDADGRCTDHRASEQLNLVATQVLEFAGMRRLLRQRLAA